MAVVSGTADVPVSNADIRGLWRRAYIKAPAKDPSFEDHDTHVYWFQADGLYADLRIPARFAAGLSAASLSDLARDDLLALAASEGFAGRATVVGGVCTWQRVINLQGPEEARDIGRLERAPGGLFEYGIEADFVELWLDEQTNGRAAEGRVFICGDTFLGCLITSPTHFLFACDQPARKALKTPWNRALSQALAEGDQDQLTVLFQPEYSFGRLEGGAAVIELSSHPNRVGAMLSDDLQATDGTLVTHHLSFDGQAVRRDWTTTDIDSWA